jgi:peptidoglycan/xylan/chitin deacetylase (PgdA/CDA1 family)
MFLKKVPILMYHSISDDKYFLSTSVKAFNQQMCFLKNLGFSTINFSDLHIDNYKKFIITFDDGYSDNYLNALPILKNYNFSATCFVVSEKINFYNDWDCGHSKFLKKSIMSTTQIKDWLSSNCHIGSHTSNHANLNSNSAEFLENEILESKKKLSHIFDVPVNTFSYPYGKLNRNSYKMVKENFNYAVTTLRGRYDKGTCNNHLLPRIPINSGTSLLKFALKLLTFYEDIKYKNNYELQLL